MKFTSSTLNEKPAKILLEKSEVFIRERRKNNELAKIFNNSRGDAKAVAALMAAGGVVGIPFGPYEKTIFILAACYDNQEALERLNEIKGRPKNQVIAIGCLPESMDYFADLESCPALVKAAEILGQKRVIDIVVHCYQHPLGLIIKAKGRVPKAVSAQKGEIRTVLTVGALDPKDENNFYNIVIWELEKGFGKSLAGTSANPSGMKSYSIYDQDKAYESFKNSIDGFVKLTVPSKRPSSHKHMTSSTIIDLTTDLPTVKRWGSTHPKRFKSIFPDLVVPKNISKEEDNESDFDLLKESLFTLIHRLFKNPWSN